MRTYRFRNEKESFSDRIPNQDPQRRRMAQLREEMSNMRYSSNETLTEDNNELLRKLHILFRK
jgi:hypothetical protein